jgi:putative peptidoglycan lipid II flippase
MHMVVARINRLRDRLSNVHPDHKRIARSAARISIFVIAGRCAGAFKEMAIAYRYGISQLVDAYQLSLTLSTLLPTILIGGLSIVLIPALVGSRTRTKAEQVKLVSEVEMVCLGLGVILTLVLFLSWDVLLKLIAGSLSEQTRLMSRQLMIGMLPVGMLSLMICVSAARLQAREKHVNTFLECVPAATLLVFVLLAPDTQSPAPLMWGTVIGFTLQAVLLRVLAVRADGIRLTPTLSLISPEWPHIYKSVGVVLLGGAVVGLATPLDQYYLAHLGDGVIATMAYANRLLALLISMGALAISRATLPILSEILETGDLRRAQDTALKWSFIMLGLGALGVIVPWALAPWAVELVFQHGAFTSQGTAAVASLFRWGLLQIPFYFAMLVLLQLFAGQSRFLEISLVAVFTFGVKAAANYWLVHLFGAVGVFLSSAVMSLAAYGSYILLFIIRSDTAPTKRYPSSG